MAQVIMKLKVTNVSCSAEIIFKAINLQITNETD